MADINSTLPVTDSADGATGSATPTSAILVGGTDGTNLRALSTTTTGILNVVATQPTASNLHMSSNTNDGSGNAITSTSINSKQRLDVNISAEGTDNAAVPFGTLSVGGVDGTGKLQTIEVMPSGEQFTRDVINVSSQYRAQSVTTTAAEAIGAATRLTNRKVLVITPTNGTIYWATTSGVTTTTGQPLFAFQTLTLAFTDNVPVYVVSAGTVDTRILEGS